MSQHLITKEQSLISPTSNNLSAYPQGTTLLTPDQFQWDFILGGFKKLLQHVLFLVKNHTKIRDILHWSTQSRSQPQNSRCLTGDITQIPF